MYFKLLNSFSKGMGNFSSHFIFIILTSKPRWLSSGQEKKVRKKMKLFREETQDGGVNRHRLPHSMNTPNLQLNYRTTNLENHLKFD